MPETVKTVRLKGFAELGYFPEVTDTATEYKAEDTRLPLDGAYSCTKTDNKTTTNIPADDNAAWDTESEWEDTTLTIAVRGILMSDLSILQGSSFAAEGEDVDETIYDEAPTVPLNFAALRAGGGYRCFTYYAAKLQSAQVSHQTKSGTTNLQDYTLEFRCKGRMADGKVRTTHEAATLEDARAWLSTVKPYAAPTGG